MSWMVLHKNKKYCPINLNFRRSISIETPIPLNWSPFTMYNVLQYIAKPTWPYWKTTGAVRFSQTEWCALLVLLSNKFGISALLFWHTDFYTKFAKICAIKVKWMYCDFSEFRYRSVPHTVKSAFQRIKIVLLY